jgi:hypothetical protein
MRSSQPGWRLPAPASFPPLISPVRFERRVERSGDPQSRNPARPTVFDSRSNRTTCEGRSAPSALRRRRAVLHPARYGRSVATRLIVMEAFLIDPAEQAWWNPLTRASHRRSAKGQGSGSSRPRVVNFVNFRRSPCCWTGIVHAPPPAARAR